MGDDLSQLIPKHKKRRHLRQRRHCFMCHSYDHLIADCPNARVITDTIQNFPSPTNLLISTESITKLPENKESEILTSTLVDLPESTLEPKINLKINPIYFNGGLMSPMSKILIDPDAEVVLYNASESGTKTRPINRIKKKQSILTRITTIFQFINCFKNSCTKTQSNYS